MCRWHDSVIWLTCVEAAMAAAGDAALRGLASNVPIPRDPAGRFEATREARRQHGTVYGFRRGCRDPAACPNLLKPDPTCHEAIQAYRADYSRCRLAGILSELEHGTLSGYHGGCRDEASCPRNATGQTCQMARSSYRRARDRIRGRASRELVDATASAVHVQRLVDSGMSIREVARRCGIGRTTAGAILAALATGRPALTTTSTLLRLQDALPGLIGQQRSGRSADPAADASRASPQRDRVEPQ